MSDEGCGIGATGGMFENWSIYLDKTVHIHEITGGLPKFTATYHAFTNLGVNIHIDIATTITFFFIGKAIATRHRPKGLGEKLNGVSEKWNFASLRFTDETFGFDKVTGIEKFELFGADKTFWSLVLFHEKLNFTEVITNFNEGELAKATNGDNATGNNDLFAIKFRKIIQNFRNLGVAIRVRRIWINSHLLQSGKFFKSFVAVVV